MSASSIQKIFGGLTAALAVALVAGPVSAASTESTPLSSFVVEEAGVLETHARKLLEMTRSKGEPAELQAEIDAFRAEIDKLYQHVNAYNGGALTAEQTDAYELIKKKLEMLDHIASNKAEMLEQSGWENRRVLKFKAENLILRTKLLAKEAAKADLPAPAASAELD